MVLLKLKALLTQKYENCKLLEDTTWNIVTRHELKKKYK